MVFEPGIQVNPVIDTPTPEAHMRHIQLGQERGSDTQVERGLLLRKTPNRGQRQAFVLHC